MKCVFCKAGTTVAGTTTVTLERGTATFVVKAVPAQVCENCGEAYVEESTTRKLLHDADEAMRLGAEVHISHYA